MGPRNGHTTVSKCEANRLVPLAYCGLASGALAILKPLIVGGLIDDYGLAAHEAGFIASSEMVGIGLSAAIASTIRPHQGTRLIFTLGAVLGMVGSAAAAVFSQFAALLCARFAAGVGCGMVAAMVLSTLGALPNADRALAAYFAMVYVAASAMFPVGTLIESRFHIAGVYLLLASLLGTCLAFSRAMQTEPQEAQPDRPRSTSIPMREAIVTLGSSVAFWCGVGAVWAFSERLGRSAGLTASQMASAFSLAQLASVAGATAAAWAGVRWGRLPPLILSMGLAALGCLLLGQGTDTRSFTAGAISLAFAWTAVLAYLGGLMAFLDHSGRIVGMSVTSQTIGMAIGPAVGGLIGTAFGYCAVSYLGISLIGCSLAILLAGMQERHT